MTTSSVPSERPVREQLEFGIRLQKEGRFLEAEAVFGRMAALEPGNSDAWHLLGMARYQAKDYWAAIDAIGRAIRLDCCQAAYFNNLGVALQNAGKCPLAAAAYRGALQLQPDYYDAVVNLARLLLQLRQPRAAYALVKESLDRLPHGKDLLEFGAAAAEQTGRLPEAAALLEEFVDLLRAGDGVDTAGQRSATLADVLLRLAKLELALLRAEKAAGRLEEAVRLNPEMDEAWFELARARSSRDDLPAAEQAIHVARRIEPNNLAYRLREIMLCPVVFESTQQIDDYRGQLESRLDELLARDEPIPYQTLFAAGFMPPYGLTYQGRNDRQIKEKFAALVRRSFDPGSVDGTDDQSLGAVRSTPARGKRRIGLVVTYGHEAIAMRSMAGVMRRLDPEKFDVGLVCHHQSAERLRSAIGRADLNVVPIDTNFGRAAQRIADARFDLLYYREVGSDALNYFLPFARLAPLQCTGWGTPVTSGLREIDYYLSWELMEKPEADAHYTERLWRMNSLSGWQKRIAAPPPADAGAFGLPSDKHLYLCPQTLAKLHPDQDDLFGQILRQDPLGLVVLIDGRQPSPGELLRRRFAQTLPDVSDRIVFVPWQSHATYYQLIQLADAVLDPIHYSAGSSAYDMFSLNRPIVAFPGEMSVSRNTLAYYRRMELTTLVAGSADEYVSLSTRLGCDAEFRAHMRRELAARTAVLFEDQEAVREHERFFEHALHHS